MEKTLINETFDSKGNLISKEIVKIILDEKGGFISKKIISLENFTV